MNIILRLLGFILAFIGFTFSLMIPIAPSIADALTLDVNDVSFLWPIPTTQQDVTKLISVGEETLAGDKIWPQQVFDSVINQAQTVKVSNNTINFGRTFAPQIKQIDTWKVVGVRVDPCAPGTDKTINQVFGCAPQIRVVAQPVTVSAAGPKIHDLTAHLVFSYLQGVDKPVVPNGPPKAIPDESKFREIVNDLKTLKADLKLAGIETNGNLSIHPGLKAKQTNFESSLKQFLQKHLAEQQLGGVAFMGLDGTQEPWIFFAMSRQPDGTFVQQAFPTLGGQNAQMITGTSFGQRIIPTPTPTNIDRDQGVSTAMLLGPATTARLGNSVVQGSPTPQVQDIPDILANPQKSHFFNTDCVSCHTESVFRSRLTKSSNGAFSYKLPVNISSVDPSLLPKSRWNVRSFGWFPPASPTRKAIPTISMRTANEAAESVEYINHKYLGESD